jgi:hypothetical protein
MSEPTENNATELTSAPAPSPTPIQEVALPSPSPSPLQEPSPSKDPLPNTTSDKEASKHVEEDTHLLGVPVPAHVDSCLYDAMFPAMIIVNLIFTVYYLVLCGVYTFPLEGRGSDTIKVFALIFLLIEFCVTVALPLWARDERPEWQPRKVILCWFGLFAVEASLGWIFALALPHEQGTTRNSVPAFAMTVLHISVLFLYLPVIYLNKYSTTYDECFRTGRRDDNAWIRALFYIMSPMQLVAKLFQCIFSGRQRMVSENVRSDRDNEAGGKQSEVKEVASP